MTGGPTIEQREQTARDFIHRALGLITRPKSSKGPVLVDVANALEELCRAAITYPDLPTLGMDVSRALFDLAPVLVEAASGEITIEEIYFALGNAAGLLTVGPDGWERDRLGYASILAAKLKITFHEMLLRERGYPLARGVQIKRLMDTPRLPTDPVH
ncbi:hypothetical protein [Pelagibacterium sp.]|uniref:hypothetical protein n=1 Tax=Pelagibacterium sp. TaxID=1967288 RepID=UPI003A8E209C